MSDTGNVESICPQCGLVGCVGYWEPWKAAWLFRCHECDNRWLEFANLPLPPNPTHETIHPQPR